MSTTDITDAEVVTGTEIVPHEAPPPALFGTDDPVEVVEKATKVATALANVIQAQRLYTTVQGKNHVHVEGWQLLGSMLGVTAVCTETVPVDGGFKATVEARTVDGRVVGRADALCTKHERRGPWKNADDYARLSMAQTRATSKALKGPLGFVISLAGYATTPAEEMTFAEPEAQTAPVPPQPVVQVAEVPKARATEIAKGAKIAWGPESRERLRQHVAGFLGRDPGEITTQGQAVVAIQMLGAEDAARLEVLIEGGVTA